MRGVGRNVPRGGRLVYPYFTDRGGQGGITEKTITPDKTIPWGGGINESNFLRSSTPSNGKRGESEGTFSGEGKHHSSDQKRPLGPSARTWTLSPSHPVSEEGGGRDLQFSYYSGS